MVWDFAGESVSDGSVDLISVYSQLFVYMVLFLEQQNKIHTGDDLGKPMSIRFWLVEEEIDAHCVDNRRGRNQNSCPQWFWNSQLFLLSHPCLLHDPPPRHTHTVCSHSVQQVICIICGAPPKEELIDSSTTPVAFLLFGSRCFPRGIFWTVLPTIQLGTSEDKYVILRKSYPIGNPLRRQKVFWQWF